MHGRVAQLEPQELVSGGRTIHGLPQVGSSRHPGTLRTSGVGKMDVRLAIF